LRTAADAGRRGGDGRGATGGPRPVGPPAARPPPPPPRGGGTAGLFRKGGRVMTGGAGDSSCRSARMRPSPPPPPIPQRQRWGLPFVSWPFSVHQPSRRPGSVRSRRRLNPPATAPDRGRGDGCAAGGAGRSPPPPGPGAPPAPWGPSPRRPVASRLGGPILCENPGADFFTFFISPNQPPSAISVPIPPPSSVGGGPGPRTRPSTSARRPSTSQPAGRRQRATPPHWLFFWQILGPESSEFWKVAHWPPKCVPIFKWPTLLTEEVVVEGAVRRVRELAPKFRGDPPPIAPP